MKLLCLILAAALLVLTPRAAAKTAKFSDVVKLVESHYGVKHRGMPLLAKMGMKTGMFFAKRLTPFPDVDDLKFAIFEDQDFTKPSEGHNAFGAALRGALAPNWQPVVEVHRRQTAEQTYLYGREDGKRYKVLLINIREREAVVIQVKIAPDQLLMLMKDAEANARTLAGETANDAQP